MRYLRIKNQKGQTAIEYVMMLAVAVSVVLAVFNKLNAYFLDNPDSYFGSRAQVFKNIYNPQTGYKYYHVPR